MTKQTYTKEEHEAELKAMGNRMRREYIKIVEKLQKQHEKEIKELKKELGR